MALGEERGDCDLPEDDFNVWGSAEGDAHAELDDGFEEGGLQGEMKVKIEALMKRHARKVMEKYGRPADPGRAQVELLGEILDGVCEIRAYIKEGRQFEQNRLADTAHEGVMDDVNATLPNTARAAHPGTLRVVGGLHFGAPNGLPDEVVTLQEVATLLRVDSKTVRRWLKGGVMPPAIKVCGVKRWRRSTIEIWLQEQEQS